MDEYLRNMQIPVIKTNEPLISDGNFFYGITNKDDEKEAIELVNKYIKDNGNINGKLFFDFKRGTKFGENRGWYTIEDNINVYENTNVLEEYESLLNGKFTGWEKVFWYRPQINNNKN